MHTAPELNGLRSDLASEFSTRPFAHWESVRLRNDTCHPVPLRSEAFSAPDLLSTRTAHLHTAIPTDDAAEEPLENKIEQDILTQVGAQSS
jgi:hypothetical protein